MDRTQLLELITKRYSLEGIQGLCFSLGIDDENVLGTTKNAKARELIQYCERNERLDSLDAAVQKRLKSASRIATADSKKLEHRSLLHSSEQVFSLL